MNEGPALGVDVGGTFTDVVVLVDGEVTTAKVPTTGDQSEGVIRGVEVACDAAGVAPSSIDRFRHATTVAVNAVLERAGGDVALVTTAGFGDVLAIGRQDRPALYDHSARRPDPLVPADRRFEVDERATPAGIERAVDEAGLRDVADAIPDAVDAVAVSFLHAYAHPDNERRAAAVLGEALEVPVSASHAVLAEFREYERTATTVADAYLRPVIEEYLDALERRCEERGLPAPQVMQANGGIATARTVRENAVTSVLSGPAAGVVGAAAFEPEDWTGLVTFDVGGTSADVSLVADGAVEHTTEADVAGHPIRIPTVDVETVGAGGGSIAWLDDGGALRVGPRSAGVDPGPACYGRGGTEPTLTDAAVRLGYVDPNATLGRDVTLDPDAAETALTALADAGSCRDAGGLHDPDLAPSVAAARGVYRVANATMARAVRRVTVERGHDVREFPLLAFGGAGPMLAAPLAARLGVTRVLVPPASGVLSAFGLLAADETHDAVRTHRRPLAAVDLETVAELYDELATDVLAETVDPEDATVRRLADLRYVGQSHELTVSVPDAFDRDTLRDRFEKGHDRARGYHLDGEPAEIVSLRVRATVSTDRPATVHDGGEEPRTGSREAFFDGSWHETSVYDRRELSDAARLDGPAVFEGGESTVVCPPDWTATVDERGTLSLEVADA